MYDYTPYCGRKHFCCYCLQEFRATRTLMVKLKTALKLMVNKGLTCQKGEYVRFKIYERKIKSPFMIYSGFKSILVPEDNGKQSQDESNKYQKHTACSYGNKLVSADKLQFY